MKRFIKEILLFSAPILAILLIFWRLFYYPGYISGELRDFDDLIILHRKNETNLMGMAYNEQRNYYKAVEGAYRKADVISLGSSRALQFKDYYFQNPESFFNCGSGVQGNYNEYVNFLINLGYNPKVLILDIDAWVFNDNWNYNRDDYEEYVQIEPLDRPKQAIIRSMISDFFKKKWKPTDLNNYSDNIGFSGMIYSSGFMYDGSYYYGPGAYKTDLGSEDRFRETLERIDSGTSRFEWGDEIDPDTITQLENLLEYCSNNNIYVIGFTAPFAPMVYKRMADSGNYGYLQGIYEACYNSFGKHGFDFYGYLNGNEIGLSDDYFTDGYHGSEVAYGMIVKDMIDKGSLLSEYVDRNVLNSLIDNRYNGLCFVDPDTMNMEKTR